MGRNRTPTNVLELRGAFDKNPQRRREDPAVEKGLGEPPAHFDEARRAAWAEIEGLAPADVLARSDRIAVEMLSDLLVRYREGMVGGPRFNSADRRDLLAILARFGLTAADRSRVAAPAEKQEQGDLFDVLANLSRGAA